MPTLDGTTPALCASAVGLLAHSTAADTDVDEAEKDSDDGVI